MITGGSSGIGLALALQCIREGAAHLCIIGSTESRLETAACLLRDACSPSQKITTIVHDVALVTLVQALQAHTRDHRPVDILVTSAGVTRPALFDETDPGTFDRLMRVNYLGTVHSVLGVLEGMKRRSRGRIIFVSSMAGQAGIVGYGAYSPTKFAVRGLAEVLSMELSPWGIGVAVCNPPNVDTPMYAGEMEIKPQAAHLCDEGSGLFTAESIAADIVAKGIKGYSFLIQSGFDGIMLGIGTGGMAPASSLSWLFVEVLALGPLRLIGLLYLRGFYAICRRCAFAADPTNRPPKSD